MKPLRNALDKLEPHFEQGGRFEKYYSLYEVFDTFLYQPGTVTRSGTHVRDGIDLKRIMITVWLATFPAMLFGMWNVGFQANTAMQAMGTRRSWSKSWSKEKPQRPLRK